MQPRPDHGEESYQGSGRLNGKKVLITGGDSGIGRAVAIAYAREGADVAINYLPDEEEDAREVVELIKKAGRNVAAIPGDIRDETFCQTLVNQAVDALGGLDILVNNAGRQQFCESIDDLTTEAFDATFKTNVYATFWITKAALRHLSSGSVIINTTSVQAYEPSDILLDYAQTKAAIAVFTKSLAKRRRAGSLLDGVAVLRRSATGKNREIWRAVPAWSTRSTGGDRTAVCHAGCVREQLHVRSGLVFRRWHRDLITRCLPANDDRRNVNESTHLSWPASR